MIGIEFLRENGFVGYENGGFKKMVSEKEVREKARYKTPNELLEKQRQARVSQDKMSYANSGSP